MDGYTLDIDAWIARFPLAAAPPVVWQAGGVTSPGRVAYLEQIRMAAIAALGDLGPSVPTDIFVFGEGEPPNRDMTLIGGLPYRAAKKPWPKSRAGEPMTFQCQFRFAESMDFMGPLPSDMLLIFIENDNPWEVDLLDTTNKPTEFAYEWYPLGLTDLIYPSELPEPYWKFFNGYGVRHRTVDYTSKRALEVLETVVPPTAIPGYPINESAAALCRIHGVKIGGDPWWWYPDHISWENGYNLVGRPLCSICEIGPPSGSNPWINHPAPIEFSLFQGRHLDFGDGFVINFFMDDDFHITKYFQTA